MDNHRNLSLFLHSSDSIYYLTTDRDGRYTYANDLFLKIFGGLAEDITCENFSTTLYSEDLPQFVQAREECLNNPGHTSCADLRRSRADGSMFWTRWEFCALQDKGQIIGIQAIGNDITERKREESERIIAQNNLHLLLNNTDEAFIMVGRDLNILTYNKSAEEKMFRFFGKNLKKGLSILLFADPERTVPLRKLYLDVLEGSEHISSTRIIENGRTIIYSNSFKAAYDSNNRIVGIIVTSRDITQNSFAEEKLNRERYLLRTLIDHLPDYIYVKDTNSRHIINNLAQLKLMGAANEEETIGKTVMDYFDEASSLDQVKKDQAVLQSGAASNNVEESVVNKAGKKTWLLTTKVPLKEEDGRVIGLVGISRDISEKKKIEESLRLSVERSNILSKATNDAIWDWDLVTGNIVWNDAVKLFGFTPEEINSDQDWWQHHLHEEDRERVMSKILRYIEKGIESWQDQYRFICADGTYKSIFDRGFILFNDEQKPVRMIGAMVDVSDRVKLQDELTAHKIARQRHITEAAIMAQEKERAEIGRELHDNINQILTTTKLYIDMAMNEKDISEELMLKSHSNISGAIEEIRILSKSLVPPSLGDIGLREAITEMIDNLNNSQKIKIKLRTNGLGKTDIEGNIKLMVFRIIQEQLNNILKHSKASEAEIKLAVSKENLNITVTDNGIGFDTRKKIKGIGLTNITSRAEVHNGQVEIISSPGNGCTLKITIPV